MKKLTRLLPCLLLCAALAFVAMAVLPTTAQAVDNSPISGKFASGTTEAKCPACNEVVTWQALSATKTVSKAGEHYYLAEDLRWTESTPMLYLPQSPDATACLHLNGKSIYSVEARVIDGGKGNLNIMGDGTVTSGKSGVGAILSTWGGETVNLYGGTYKTVGSGSAIYVVGTVNIHDGVTVDASGAHGGTLASCVCVAKEESVANLSGGKLIGTDVTGNGGTVSVTAGKFTMSGGTISGGKVTGFGGNVVVQSGGTFTMTGGTIEGGTAEGSGGNLHVTGSNLKLSGGTIKGGTAKTGGNISFHNAEKSALSGGIVEGGTAEGSGGNLYIGTGSKVELSGAKIKNGETTAAGGNVCLSGASLTMSAGTLENGTAEQGGNINMSADAEVTLSGGTISGGTSVKYGGNICMSTGKLTISGAKITGGVANHAGTGGGNLYATTEATVKMTSGTISGGTASHGGNVYIYRGTMNMSGGTISGGTSTNAKGGSVYLYGWEEYKCKLNVSGGKLTGGDLYIAGPDAAIKVTGGTVESKVDGKTENLTITGGSFSEYMGENIGEGMDMYQTEDGSYIPYDTSSVAVVNGKMYKSFADAYKAATLDKPVTLLADVTDELLVTGKKAINLDGHTIGAIRVEKGGQLKIINNQAGRVEKLTAPMGQVELQGGQYSTTFGIITNTGTWQVENNIYGDITNASGAALTILGGEFTGKLEGDNITVAGGVFASDVKALLKEGIALHAIDGGRYIACGANAAAAVEGVAYDTLQAALDTDPWGKTVYLLRDCDEQAKYETKGKNAITLMTNGFTLKEMTVGTGANFTVDASRGGKVTTLHQYVRVRVPDGNYAAAIGTLYNYIDITIHNGTYGDFYSEGKLTISGGTFTGLLSSTALEISAGTFTGTIQCENTVITGGSFASDVSQWVSEGYVCKKSGDSYTVGVPEPFDPVPYIIGGGAALLVVILVVAILLTRNPRKKETEVEKEA